MSDQTADFQMPIRGAIHGVAERLGVKAIFSLGRRKSDIVYVEVYGNRWRLFEMMHQVFDQFPGMDVQLMSSALEGEQHKLSFFITQKLRRQPLGSPERRATLRLHHYHEPRPRQQAVVY